MADLYIDIVADASHTISVSEVEAPAVDFAGVSEEHAPAAGADDASFMPERKGAASSVTEFIAKLGKVNYTSLALRVSFADHDRTSQLCLGSGDGGSCFYKRCYDWTDVAKR